MKQFGHLRSIIIYTNTRVSEEKREREHNNNEHLNSATSS